MKCLNCNMPMPGRYRCPHCGQVDRVSRKCIYSSNWHYNKGLSRAGLRDISGAIISLRRSLKYNKRNTQARNLLGLCYYQIGEIVDALSEWVISVHFQETDNPAKDYIRIMQEDPAGMKLAGRVVKKYNVGLQYVQEGSEDLAVLELKKVVDMNPNFVRAYQLLALVHIHRKQYKAARKVLMRAVKVDRNNITTLQYLQEVNSHLDTEERNSFSPLNGTIFDPNPVMIEENTGGGYQDYNTGYISFINIIIGIIIGVSVVALLVVPTVSKQKALKYNESIVGYSAQISDRNKEIAALRKEVAELSDKVAQYDQTVGEVINDDGTSKRKLIQAASSYLQDEIRDAGMLLSEIEPAAITDGDELRVYHLLRNATADYVSDTLYANALAIFEDGDYLGAIDGMTKVLRMDDTYTRAIFYLGRSYQMLGDAVNAADYYTRLINRFPNSSKVEDAQYYLDQIRNATGLDTSGMNVDEETESAEEGEGAEDGDDDYSDEGYDEDGYEDEDPED